MTKRLLGIAAVAAAAAIVGIGMSLRPGSATAADHEDGPAAAVDPAADLTDLFAWMSPDGQRLNLIANVFYAATFASEFSPAVQYAFHVESGDAYGAVGGERVVLCQFYQPDRVECWIGDEYVEGDPSDPAGLTSASGRLRVFAGRRDDPFFIEYEGFMATIEQVIDAAPSLTFDAEGCPDLAPATQSALVGQLQSGRNGAPVSDGFVDQDILSLVVQLDPALVAVDGPILAVWASTHAAQ